MVADIEAARKHLQSTGARFDGDIVTALNCQAQPIGLVDC
jgi:hypothetical protein